MMSSTSPSHSPSSSSDNNINTTTTTVDSTPFLSTTSAISDHIFLTRRFVRGPPSLRGAARFLRRASSRGMLREPSMRVRESAAEQIEERQSDWAYSRPIVILDLIWNLAFIVVSIAVLIMSLKESPVMPLRVWIAGYALQCVLHMVCVYVEYKQRSHQRSLEISNENSSSNSNSNSSSGSVGGENVDFASGRLQNDDDTRVITMVLSLRAGLTPVLEESLADSLTKLLAGQQELNISTARKKISMVDVPKESKMHPLFHLSPGVIVSMRKFMTITQNFMTALRTRPLFKGWMLICFWSLVQTIIYYGSYKISMVGYKHFKHVSKKTCHKKQVIHHLE